MKQGAEIRKESPKILERYLVQYVHHETKVGSRQFAGRRPLPQRHLVVAQFLYAGTVALDYGPHVLFVDSLLARYTASYFFRLNDV